MGKADWEINLGLDYDIFCFNVESVPELEIINELAAAKGKVANVAFRINPNVGAHTHANITTGLAENKFGISMQDMDHVIDIAQNMKNLRFIGLHFHIGSQILDMGDFVALCNRVNELQDKLEARHIRIEHVNVGADSALTTVTPTVSRYPTSKLLRDLQQPSETPSPPDAPLRAGTCGSGTMRFIDFAGALCEAGHQQAVCHSGCRHDGFDSSGTLPSVP